LRRLSGTTMERIALSSKMKRLSMWLDSQC
jgi:hypothetical protein